MANIEEYDYLFKVIVIGDEGSGKSALLTRYADDAFSAAYVSTIGVDFKIKSVKQGGNIIKAQIWDTAGQERFRNITSSYYRGSHGVMIVFDVTNRQSYKGVHDWITDLEHYGSKSIPILLVGNKCDLSEKRCVTYEEANSLAVINNMEYIETSANTNVNVHDAFDTLYAEIRKKMTKEVAPQENVVRLDTVSVAKETKGFAVEEESTASTTVEKEPTASITTEDIPPWAKEMMKELQRLNSRLESMEKLENRFESMSKRLDVLENKVSKFDSSKVYYKSPQKKSAK